jgi:uncharacterized protein YkwD
VLRPTSLNAIVRQLQTVCVLRLAVLAGSLLLACGPRVFAPLPPGPPDPPPVRELLAAPLVFAPSAAAAAAYNEPIADEPNTDDPGEPVLAEVFAALVLADETATGSLERDRRLDLVARELAAFARGGGAISSGLTSFAMRSRGVPEPAVNVMLAWGASAEDIAAELRPKLVDARTRTTKLGLGGIAPTVAIITYRPGLALGPFPRSAAVGEPIVLSGSLAPSLRSPRARLVEPSGVEHVVAVRLEETGDIHGELRCPRAYANEYWLRVEAWTGTRYIGVAMVPFSCGSRPPERYRLEPARNLDTADIETRLLSIINREREAARIAPLIIDPRAAIAARRHADAMARARSIEHVLEGTSPVDRLAAAGVKPPASSESTLHAESLGEAAETLLNDPRYRDAVLDPKMTHVGLAAATGKPGWYVAIVYVKIVPPVDIQEMTFAAQERVEAAPTASRWLRHDESLTELARSYAAGLARGIAPSEVWNEIAPWFFAERLPSGRQIFDGRVRGHVLEDVHVTSLEPDLGPRPFDTVGVGVAQSDRHGPLAGQIWVVVLYGCEVRRWPGCVPRLVWE